MSGWGNRLGAAPAAQSVAIVYFQAGSGHWTAALALEAALRRRWPDWRVRTVDLAALVAGDRLYGWTLRAGIARFNGMLRRDDVRDLEGLIRFGIYCHDRLTPRGLRRIAGYWAAEPADIVVSVTPMTNGVIWRSARLANPAARCVVLPVDFEEAVPGYWFVPGADLHYLLGSARLLEQARERGIPAVRVHPLPGMLVHPDSYAPAPPRAEAAERLRRLGLDPGLPTVLVAFGAQGSVLVRAAAREIAGAGLRVNLILMCGRSTGVAAELRGWAAPLPKAVLDFVDDPLAYRRLADVLIGKPGTMTIGEAVVEGRPLIAVRTPGMARVQRGNERWVAETGVGEVVDAAAGVPAALRRILAERGRYEARMRAERSQGVFAAAEILPDLAGPVGDARRRVALS